MKIKSLISVVCFFVIGSVWSQNFGSCGFDSTGARYTESLIWSNSGDTWLEYRSPTHWIPNQNTPLKTILVNWIVCRDNFGQNGWQDVSKNCSSNKEIKTNECLIKYEN